MRRTQALAALVVALLAVGGAAYADRELGPSAPGPGASPQAPSGVWFCPHGGGAGGSAKEWQAFLQVANPGTSPSTIRVRTLGGGHPAKPQVLTVDPRASIRIQVPADARERASVVEWFDQWVGVAWISHAGGSESGVAAEPCSPEAGTRWLLPDGTTESADEHDFVVVMNPFARDAVFSVALLSERTAPVELGELTDVVLHPYRSRVIALGDIVKGERTVSTVIQASVGRVVASTLGVSAAGGVRSAIGYLDAAPDPATFPGGHDSGRTDLAVMNAQARRAAIGGELIEKEEEQPFTGLEDAAPPQQSGRTYTASTTTGATSVVFSGGDPHVAASRRTFGVVSDQASTNGAAPAAQWLILPAVMGSPSHPGLLLANPGSEPAEVELSFLSPDHDRTTTVSVPARSTVPVPADFLEVAPQAAVTAIATAGTFVAASASYSLGGDGYANYAVSLGIAIPQGVLG